METNRANLDQPQSNTRYIFFTIVFVILSIVGVILFLQIKSTPVNTETVEVPVESVPTVEPTNTPAEGTPYPEGHRGESTPSAITQIPAEGTPTPIIETYLSPENDFTLSYKSDRKVYKIDEATGYRIAFYRAGGNIAVHVGTTWSWSNPGREFQSGDTLSGQPAFRYDIAAQTLIDVEYKGRFYTIQCIHSSDEILKAECEQFVTSFKFL